MKKNIIITEKFAREAYIHLKSHLSQYDVFQLSELKTQTHTQIHNQENLISDIFINTEILIIRSKTKITSSYLNNYPQLKLIITCTSGYDHLDLRATQERNIQTYYCPESHITSAAELTLGLMLSLVRHIPQAHQEVKNANWHREKWQGSTLYKKELGLIGFGRIGQKVAQLAQAFQMNVSAYDPYQSDEVFQEKKCHRLSYEEVLKNSDILSFHVPHTLETHHMLNASHFEYVAPELKIINASRGSVIKEQDLIMALQSKKISGAALDVFEKEPLEKDHPFLTMLNVILTPHMGALTEEAFLDVSFEAAQKILKWVNNELIEHELPLQNEWGSLMFEDQIQKAEQSMKSKHKLPRD